MRYILTAAWTVFLYMMIFSASALAAEPEDNLKGLTEILDVRINDEDGKLRIVVDADTPVSISKMALSNPERVAVDIKNAWVSPKAKRDGPLNSECASRLRVAQFDKNTVRVVVEIREKGKPYNVFTMEGGSPPGRVVLDFGSGNPSAKKENDPVLREASGDNASDIKEKEKKEQERKEKERKEKEKKEKKERERQEKEEKKAKEEERDTSRKDNSMERQLEEITGLKGRSITIDPGHGGSDSGAIGPTGVMEKEITLRISLELEKLLKAEGATVYMTRTKDTEVSPKGPRATDVEELQARCDIANRRKSDIFISIHMDSFTNKEAKGTTGYYYSQGSQKGRELADKIRSNLVDQLGTQSRGTQTCNFYVVKNTDMPATLIEVAFVSNPEEEKLLNSKEGIKKAATAIADGIADYFG